MFRKVLIANRGEIALRIICACKELQVRTVAVYSEADRHCVHVRFSDEAVCIGPAKSYESYLNIPSIISAAEITNVDAIHPGYGYLAESSYFAEVCETCGIKFIGPPPAVIELMGDKVLAKKKMCEAGLPIIPGTGIIKDTGAELEGIAEEVGYPLIIKAVAGGGGRGMRVVTKSEQLRNALATAQSEAESAFGSSDVYIERYLDNPRHIEFQILGDQHGNVVHLGERECSIQRRHQKLIEESPSPIVSEELRQDLGQRVVQAMKAINYQNTGTVEFLFDQEDHYYFIEMNTRVQVEHPVTEMVTGLDIVKEQLRIAAGEKLGFAQQDVLFRGHSLECRINAECPETFAPSPGKITAYHPPGGPGIRIDSAAYTDYVVSPHYDSLIAKLIAYGVNRQEALARLNRALDLFVIEGIETSIPLHKKIINHPDFIKGQFGTSFLGQLRS
ncbi:acetyl-CoA carboxylase biotin carboxylase subunit [Acidobacteria bacterium AH-259-O06]|nr:acetyl-CoA carboxylase biotin carboxylase subunit [Acidobacteria bacterium AH-259-O06]